MINDKKTNRLMSIRKIKITPFLIFAVVALIYAIRYNLFNFWTLKGGASLIGIYAIAALGISVVLIVSDRQFLKRFTLRRVYLIESIIISLIGIFYLHHNRRLICELDNSVDYFVIVYDIGGEPKLDYSFPFSKKMVIDKNGIYLIRDKDNFKNSNKIIRQDLKSHSTKIYNVNILDKPYRTELITINNTPVDFDSLEIKIENLLIRE